MRFIGNIILPFLAMGLSFYQSQRALSLIDWSFMVENAYRLLIGQRPYVDFGIVLPPGMFIIQALLLQLPGSIFRIQQCYVAACAFISVSLTLVILKDLGLKEKTRFLIAMPLIFLAPGVISPHPSYDHDTVLFALIAILVFIRTTRNADSRREWMISGFMATVPLFFKQTMGLGFLIGFACLATMLGRRELKATKSRMLSGLAAGAALAFAAIAICLVGLSGWAGPQSAFTWIFLKASQSRSGFVERIFADLLNPKVHVVVLCWVCAALLLQSNSRATILAGIPIKWLTDLAKRKINTTALICGYVLILTPFIQVLFQILHDPFAAHTGLGYFWSASQIMFFIAILFYFMKHRSISLDWGICGLGLAISLAGFASQGAAGSSYGLWPIFIVIWGAALHQQGPLFSIDTQKWIPRLVFIPILATAGYYVAGNYRLIAFLPTAGANQKMVWPRLEGMSAMGPWLGELNEMLVWVEANIPHNQTVVDLPGEDPFYAATRRQPQLSLFQMNQGIFPYPVKWMSDAIIENKIDWVIVKTHLQLPEGYFDYAPVVVNITGPYVLKKKLLGYDIYQKLAPTPP